MAYRPLKSSPVAGLDNLNERVGSNPHEHCALDCLRPQPLAMEHRSEQGLKVAPAKRATPKDTAASNGRHLLGRVGDLKENSDGR